MFRSLNEISTKISEMDFIAILGGHLQSFCSVLSISLQKTKTNKQTVFQSRIDEKNINQSNAGK